MTLRTPLALVAALGLSLVVALTGCATSSVPGSTSPSPGAATPSPSSTAVDAVPNELRYQRNGNAFDNKAYFDSVLRKVAESSQDMPGRAMVNALVRAGFRKSDMQLTPDTTKTGLAADSVIVAVRIRQSCLIGQRTVNREYFSSVESGLKIGGCLVGVLRKIDW